MISTMLRKPIVALTMPQHVIWTGFKKLGTFRQWVTCVMICALLLPVFSLPAYAHASVTGEYVDSGVEPVNEKVPIWIDGWRAISSEIEAWATPYRSENSIGFAPPNAGEVDHDLRKRTNSTPTEPLLPTHSTGDSPLKDASTTTESASELPSSKETANNPNLLSRASAVNQLPNDERDSVYSYDNNLGTPYGQTEMDSDNESAALRIRHRAGIANFSFAVPLASLTGRGINAGAGITYNSRVWNKSVTNTGLPHFTYDVEQSWLSPGFTGGYGYLASKYVTRSVVMMNGSNTVNKTLTEIIPDGIIDQDGGRQQIKCRTYSQIPGGHSSSNYCTSFETTDGTGAFQIVRNGYSYRIDGPVDYSSTSFFVRYPGGTRALFTAGLGSGNNRKHFPIRIQDRNGNRIQIQYRSGDSGRVASVIDTIGRSIKFYYENDVSGNADKLIAVTVPGMGAGEEIQTARFYYETIPLSSASKFEGVITSPSSIRVLRWIYTPSTKAAFKYEYDSNYGMIRRIEKRVGVTVSDPTSTTTTGAIVGEGVASASTSYDYPDGTTPLNDAPKYSKRTDAWQESSQETHYGTGTDVGGDRVSVVTVPTNGFYIETETRSENTAGWKAGLVKETAVYKSTGPFLQRQRVATLAKTKYFWVPGTFQQGRHNPRLVKTESTNDSGLTKATEFDYDGYNNQKQVKEYDYALADTLGSLLRTTDITYETGAGWIGANLIGLVKEVKVTVAGAIVSKTLYEHDNGGTDSSLVRYSDINQTTHDPAYNPANPPRTCQYHCGEEMLSGYSVPDEGELNPGEPCPWICTGSYTPSSVYRGNVTQVARMLDVTSTTPDSTRDDVSDYNHDIAGNVVSATLSCCSVRTYNYTKTHEYAFAVSQTSGSSPQVTTSATFNKNTGLVLSTTDENSQTTRYEYEIDTLRRKKTVYPNGGYVLTEYSDKLISDPDQLLPGFVRQTTTLDLNKVSQSYGYFDGRGLKVRTSTLTPDGWSVSAVEHDNLGRLAKAYNPFYASTPTGVVPPEIKFTQVLAYDALGRVTTAKLQDSSIVSTHFSTAEDLPSSFKKTFVTVTDQAGQKRRQVSDALGRSVRVDEPDSSGNLGAVDASLPGQQTSYAYDGNGNLSQVFQSDGTNIQERKFKYDSLSRLTHERDVESDRTLDADGMKGAAHPDKWTKYLKYQPDGLLDYAVDSKDVRTSFTYDGLNRVRTVTYTGETGYITPNVTYTYDQSRNDSFNTGRLTRVETHGTTVTPVTATEFDYDLMGRVHKHRQWIAGQQYDLEYTYNIAGQMTSEKYPSGRAVSFASDANGRLSSIADASRTYLNNVKYEQHGGVISQFALGNGTLQNLLMNDRLQIESQELKRGSEVLQKYSYKYGEIDANGDVDATKNNGQLAQVESFIGTSKQWTQKFSYDWIGRLTNAEERRGDTNAVSYKQRFDYDRFGNLYRILANIPVGQETPLPTTWIESTDISKSTNRFTSGSSYDEKGQLLTDNKFRMMSFTYDANGRVANAAKVNVPDAFSVYDGAGRRVAERINDVWRFSIYDIGGRLVGEYGGAQATDEGGVKFVLQDCQGSVRAVLGNTGLIQARMDNTAFGEPIASGTGLRSTQQGFSVVETLRPRYGLTEKDDASGLDHAWFRKLENRAGRWTSPDPYGGSMVISNPQSFNRYSYVLNRPTNFIDPTGLLTPGEPCATNPERVGPDGHPTYDGTVDSNGQCRSHAGSPVQIQWTGGWINTGGNNSTWVPAGGYLETSPREPGGAPSMQAASGCLSVGVSISGTAVVGAGGKGAAVTAGVAFGQDVANGEAYMAPSGGIVAGGTNGLGGVGAPSREGVGIGAYVDIGPSLHLSRAGQAGDLEGVSETHMFGSPLISIQMGMGSGGKWQTLEIGPPAIGLGYFKMKTQTAKPLVQPSAIKGRPRLLCGP